MAPHCFLLLILATQHVAFTVDSTTGRVLHQIHVGAVVRVRAVGGPRLTAAFVGIDGSAALLRTSSPFSQASRVAVDSLWTRHHPIVRKAIKGTLLGAFVGGVVQFARSLRASCHGTGIFSPNWPYPDCRATVGNFGRAAAFWGAVGGAGGAMIGLAFPEWKLRAPL